MEITGDVAVRKTRNRTFLYPKEPRPTWKVAWKYFTPFELDLEKMKNHDNFWEEIELKKKSQLEDRD